MQTEALRLEKTIVIHKATAAEVWKWITDAAGLVMQAPLLWVIAILVWLVLSMVIGAILPGVGSVLLSILSPVFQAGLILGAHAQAQGVPFKIESLFAGFSEKKKPLLILGIIFVTGLIVVLGIASMFSALLFIAMGINIAVQDIGSVTDLHVLAGILGGVLLAALIFLLLSLPLLMAFWYAPALVALNGMEPLEAMRWSFRACQRNVISLAVYSVILLVLFLLACVPLFLGLLIWLPVALVSIYTSWKNIFRQVAISAEAKL